MKRVILFLAAAMMAIGAQAQVFAEQAFPSYVEVNGVAEREVEPNLIYLTITINERESKGRITVDEQEQDMIRALRSLGIDTKEQLRVNDISSSRLKRSQAVTTKSYQLQLTEPSIVGEVYVALQAVGITAIGIEKATHTDIEKLRGEVRDEAMRNARSTAQSLAAAVDQTIGKAFYINYYQSSQPTVFRMANVKAYVEESAADMAAGVVEQPEFRKLKLTANVQAKFVLE
ncbi:MAG: SIMPL domain-containing protein [Rikenellaceae bacterium]|nr:SIMPL domain-containing protein [Rikenellaceae bacterium]